MYAVVHTSLAPPLSHFVEHLWWLSDVPAHAREHVVPSGTLELVVNPHEDEFRVCDRADPARCLRFPGAMVSGAYGRFFVVDTRAHASMVGVHFRPGGALALIGAPPGVLADTHVDLAVLWGRASAGALRERLCAAATIPERFRILEQALVQRLRRPARRHGAVPVAVDALGRGGVPVGGVAARLELSRRRLIEVFTAEVGMTPKRFARVRRFQRTLALAQRLARPDWGRIALECGYFDQSHLIREFLELSGFSPVELLRRRTIPVKENHVALADPAGQIRPIPARRGGLDRR